MITGALIGVFLFSVLLLSCHIILVQTSSKRFKPTAITAIWYAVVALTGAGIGHFVG